MREEDGWRTGNDRAAVKKMKGGKAAGPDDIPV